MKSTTKDLSDELLKREGVSSIDIEPYEKAKIITESTEKVIEGPAIIIVNQD